MIERAKRERNIFQKRIFLLILTSPFGAAENIIFSLLNKYVWDAIPMEQSKVFLWGIIFSIYLILSWGIGSLNTVNQVFFSKEAACRLKEQVYSHYIKSKQFLYKRKSLSSTINHDIPMLEEDFYYAIVSCLMRGEAVLLAFFVTFSVHISYGIFCFIVLAIPILLSIKKADTLSDIRQKFLEKKEEYTGFLAEMGRGKETILQYQLLETILDRHKALVEQIAMFGAKKREQIAVNQISSQSINRLATEVVSLVGFYLVSRGELTLGWVMAFNQLSSSMTFSLVEMLQFGINIYSCFSVRRKIWTEYGLAEKDEKFGWKGKRVSKKKMPQERLTEFMSDRIKSEKVGCHCDIKSCKLGERQILDEIDFSFAPGEKVLITGENGSGKTTLLKILLGLNQEFEGTVEWMNEKGERIKEEESEKIAYIPQNPFLFEGSVKENILLDALEEEMRYQEIKKKVSLNLEDDKKIHTLQQNISGGEKQKIELARAIYSKRNRLILDEPYSALDQEALLETERYLLEDPDRTVIVVSHAEREETKGWYTMHLVLEDGRLKQVKLA